jgi:hypothetical protein
MVIFGLSAETQALSIALPSIVGEYAGMLWSELREFLGHYIIVLLALVMTWAAKGAWFDCEWAGRPRLTQLRRKSRHGLIIILVLAILAFSGFKTNRVVRARTAQESRVRAEQAYTYAHMQLAATPKSDTTAQLVILSLGIGQITTRTFELIRNSHPEFKLRVISVHLQLSDGRVEDVIQEGVLKKDTTVFPKGSSFVGATIQAQRTMYCPDLSKREQYPECKSFNSNSSPPYASLICYPFSLRYGESFGAVCLDSIMPHAFDDAVGNQVRQDKTYEDIREQMDQLATLLDAFNHVRSDLESAQEKPKKKTK